jgi:hypothetical protein
MMKRLVALFALTLSGLSACDRLAASVLESTQQEKTMTAKGTFDVKVTPQAPDADAGPFGRLLLDKQYHGALAATSKGQMLGTQFEPEGSGAYVAMELVSGTLDGKRGTFMLQHNGTMSKGVSTMHVTVIPNSGTDQLKGISGRMTIIIEGKEHRYELEYRFESA